MTALLEALRRQIATDGPLPVDRYMALALGHPSHGYYATRDPFGAAGDFVTAPEISQIFGELIGIWLVDCWDRMGRPDPFQLVELGPGRGTLMRDAIRAARVLPGFAEAARIHLVETSPTLKALQAQMLGDSLSIDWHDRLADVPDGPILAVANEFFDALPVRQFERSSEGWRERMVTADATSGGLRFVLSDRPDPLVEQLPVAAENSTAAAIVEFCPAGLAIAGDLGRRTAADGGAALIIDYGHVRPATGDTLQAVRRHRYADPLADPGEADLTTHVDFAMLADAASEAGAAICGPSTQAAWLETMGIGHRAARLKQSASDHQAADIDAAVLRLTAPDQMGELFKIMSLSAPSLTPTAGLAIAEGTAAR